MKTILAIDPGSESSAVVEWDGERIVSKLYAANASVLCELRQRRGDGVPCVIEMIGHYGTGMPAGKTVFDTCVWIGRFTEGYGAERVETILPATVKAHICGSARAKDGNIRMALIDRLGGPGTKKAPGATYGISKDLWAALAVAVTWWDGHVAEGNVPGVAELKARIDRMIGRASDPLVERASEQILERKGDLVQRDIDFEGRVQ